MKNCLVMVVAAFFVCGCEGNVLYIASLNEEQIQKVKDYDLCQAYGTPLYGRTKNMRAEIVRRKLFSETDLALIDKSQIRIDGSELMIPAAWGPPRNVHETRTRDRVHRQWVYEIPKSRRWYAYSDNGIITTFQN